MESAFYIRKLQEDFTRRQRSNPSYSLRSYARDLELHPSTLSHVLTGKRTLPRKNSQLVLERIPMNAKERTLFVDSLWKRHIHLDQIPVSEIDDRLLLDETYFQIIAEWEHYAVLTLMDCENFDQNPAKISERLGITEMRAKVVLENLLRYGLLNKREEDQSLFKAHPRVRTTEDVASQALRASHRETIELSQKKLEEVPVELRDFSSMMVAMDLEKLPEAKAIIREFRQKLDSLLQNGKRTEVYQLAIQFYPITETIHERKKL